MKKIGMMMIILSIITGMAVYAAGGQQQSGVIQSSGGPVKLTVMIAESLRVLDFKTNHQTKLIEQATNTDLAFVLLPETDYINRLNLMVMAGGTELPDIIIGNPGDARVYQWAQEGAIIGLKKYYDDPRLNVNVRDAINRAGYNFLDEVKSPDGEIYGVPTRVEEKSGEYSGRFWYYKPWADKLGLREPTTTEEFRSFLKAAVNSDPNGNGRNDEIGLTGTFLNMTGGEQNSWFNFCMNPFIYVGSQLVNVDNGTLNVPYNTEAWRTGLKYIRSLFVEGLIPIETLTQDRNQFSTLLNSDPVRIFCTMYTLGFITPTTNPKHMDYIGMAPLKGVNGTQFTTVNPQAASISFMISSNCKNPEAAFRVGDVGFREDISITSRFGEQGVNWDYVRDVPNYASKYVPFMQGEPPSIITYDDGEFWSGLTPKNGSWRNGTRFIAYEFFYGRQVAPDATQGPSDNRSRTMSIYFRPEYTPKEYLKKLIYNETEMSYISEVKTTLDSYVFEMTSSFLAGNRDIDASWNSYIAELNNIGLPRVLSTMQSVYNRMYK